MLSTTLQPLQGVAATPQNLQSLPDLTFLLEGLDSSPFGGQMYGEGGAAVTETALQTFLDAQLQPATPAPLPRKRGKALTVCPEHPLMNFKSKAAFKKHIQSHANKFHCSQEGCNKRSHIFKTVRDLYHHVTRSHGSELVGKPAVRFRCGHCEQPPTPRKVNLFYHLKMHHLKPSEQCKIRALGEVEKYSLSADDPSNSEMKILTLAAEFLNEATELNVAYEATLSSFWEMDMPVFCDPEPDDLPLSEAGGPIRRERRKAVSICPEHHDEVFASRNAFKEHIQAHANIFCCSQPDCKSRGRIYSTHRLLYFHVIQSHGTEPFGKQSLYFQCGHCEKPPTLRKRDILEHIRVCHLVQSQKPMIRHSGKVEHYCLPADDPSSSMRTLTLAAEFLAPQKPELDQSSPEALTANQMQI